MKSLAVHLLVILALTGTASAHNATSTPLPTLFIGQDQTSGDAIMSIGPDREQAEPFSSPQELIITPEIILPPKNHRHPHGKAKKARIRHPSSGPHTP
ncbi:hypothetical protein [Desulfoplanes formicivorans]|uniref:hypothetical protein n=1 Tax=Desulfoplanes formicivorans TaxID=1592317 RepID=UPI00085356DB|nr:hypothetical protein [Desulfoplanes formicivorans]